jgi:hypothetical protein
VTGKFLRVRKAGRRRVWFYPFVPAWTVGHSELKNARQIEWAEPPVLCTVNHLACTDAM